MKKLATLLFAGSLALTLTACGGGQQAQPQAPSATQPSTGGTGSSSTPANAAYDAATAQARFESNCASCHGKDLAGGMGPNLQKVGSKYSKDQILNIIKNGRGQMPPGMAQGTDADNIAAWLADKK